MAIKIVTTVKGGRGFATQIDRWTVNLRTMGPAFNKVADYQAREWQKQFATEGSHLTGRWAPLSPGYKKWKAAHFPGQGILVRTGRLKKSFTQRPLGIEEVSSKGVRLGSDVPYAVFHQRGTKFMPRRPLYATTPNSTRNREIVKILQRYITTGKV